MRRKVIGSLNMYLKKDELPYDSYYQSGLNSNCFWIPSETAFNTFAGETTKSFWKYASDTVPEGRTSPVGDFAIDIFW